MRTREFLQGVFNFARGQLEVHERAKASGRQASERLSGSPASLSERPVLRLIMRALEIGEQPRHVRSLDGDAFSDAVSLRRHVEARVADGSGVVAGVEYSSLGTQQPIALLDAVTGILAINLEHPFVAHFADEFGDEKRNLPLQLFAMSELLLEAQLYVSGASRAEVLTVLDERDELLRHLAKSKGAQNSLTVAQDLVASASSKDELEKAVVAAFDQLGFEAVPKGGNNDCDGIAEALLSADGGVARHYRVSLEAKSKEKPDGRVTKTRVGISTIARHRDTNDCDHAIVVGPAFETGPADTGAVVLEIDKDRKGNPGKTITLVTITDLARLVRLAPLKRMSLVQLRELLKTARTPSEVAVWIDTQEAHEPLPAPYRDILETVWSEQGADKNYSVEYSALRTALRLTRGISVTEDDLRNDCIALERMAPNLFYALAERVELNIKPEKVLAAVKEYVDTAPADD